MVFVDPRLTKNFIEWSDYMNPTLEEYGAVVGRVLNEDDWQSWAAGIISLNGIAQAGAPNPYQFTDWKVWAMRFNSAMNQGA